MLFPHLTLLDRTIFPWATRFPLWYLIDQQRITCPHPSCKESWERKFQLFSAFTGIELWEQVTESSFLTGKKKGGNSHYLSQQSVAKFILIPNIWYIWVFLFLPHPHLYPRSPKILILYNILWMPMSELTQRSVNLSSVNETLRTTSKMVDDTTKDVHLWLHGLGVYATTLTKWLKFLSLHTNVLIYSWVSFYSIESYK